MENRNAEHIDRMILDVLAQTVNSVVRDLAEAC